MIKSTHPLRKTWYWYLPFMIINIHGFLVERNYFRLIKSSRFQAQYDDVSTFAKFSYLKSTKLFSISGISLIDDNDRNNIDDKSLHGGRIHIPAFTIILPAYNEENRIQTTIQTYRNHLQEMKQKSIVNFDSWCEILVVDDGSTDNTKQVVNEIIQSFDKTEQESKNHIILRIISQQLNQGKGSAISLGVADVDQKYSHHHNENSECIILVADADGSGNINNLEKMLILLKEGCSCSTNQINQNYDNHHASKDNMNASFSWNRPVVIVGNRGYNGTSISRSITRWGFRTAVYLICGNLGIKDTQSGFKFYTLSAARCLYSQLNLKRWSHDVEVLFRAKEMGFFMNECEIDWEDKEGSKLVQSFGGTIRVSLIMLLEIIVMRTNYLTKRWRLPADPQS